MKEDKEQWIEEVMRSLDGLQQSQPSPFLYNRVIAGIKESVAYNVSKTTIWLAAASFALVLLLNFQAIRSAGSGTRSEQQELRELAVQYQMLNTNALYN